MQCNKIKCGITIHARKWPGKVVSLVLLFVQCVWQSFLFLISKIDPGSIIQNTILGPPLSLQLLCSTEPDCEFTMWLSTLWFTGQTRALLFQQLMGALSTEQTAIPQRGPLN